MANEKASIKRPSLILNGLESNTQIELKPYQYREHSFDNRLTIYARINMSEVEYSDLGKLPEIVEVTRRDIDETPREMEFQEVLWSKSDNKIKEEIRLYDKEDKKELPWLGWIGNMAMVVAEQDLIIDELLNVLISENVLKEEKIKEIKEKLTGERNWLKRREFNRSRVDIDEFKSLEE